VPKIPASKSQISSILIQSCAGVASRIAGIADRAQMGASVSLWTDLHEYNGIDFYSPPSALVKELRESLPTTPRL
jgi:hypothetical protein